MVQPISHISTRLDIAATDPNEGTYLTLWQKYNYVNRGDSLLGQILSKSPNQREALVAASFIQWLGCREGLLFLMLARRKSEPVKKRPAHIRPMLRANAFRDAFKERGQGCLIYRYTLLQGIMHCSDAHRRLKWDERDPLSKRDQQVCDLVLGWLSTPQGTRFINNAEEKIDALHAKEMADFHAKYNLRLATA